MYPDKFTTTVKQGDINNGRLAQSGSCPVALALIRRGWADPCVGANGVILSALGPANFMGLAEDMWLPTVKYRAAGLDMFVVSFDSDLTVKPITLNFVLAEEK